MWRLLATESRRLGPGIAVVLGLILLSGLFIVAPAPDNASATRASGGSGIYRNQIEWFEWGSAGAMIPDSGASETISYRRGGVQIDVNCSISEITRTAGEGSGPLLEAYRPGTWKNDGLPELYNVGGTGARNRLVAGIANRTQGNTIDFSIDCSAKRGNTPAAIEGLVMADAEALSDREYIKATPRPNSGNGPNPGASSNSGTWRIIERSRASGCERSTIGTRSADNSLQLNSSAGECRSGGSTAVSFIDGATSAQVSIRGSGKTAIALGVMLSFDHGDAPDSYGDAGHATASSWDGGTINPDQPVDLISGDFPLANRVAPGLTLGEGVTDDDGPRFSAAADADERDDGWRPSTIEAIPGEPYQLPALTCRGTGPIRGWVDVDRNGTFDDDEASSPGRCENNRAALVWPQMPADLAPVDDTFLRLRYAADPADIARPVGLANSGEVEDYGQIAIAAPTLRLIKSLPERAAGSDQFRLSVENGATTLASAQTSGSETVAKTRSLVVGSGAYTLREEPVEGATGAEDYAGKISCIDRPTGKSVPVSGSYPNWQIAGLQSANRVECTITNNPITAGIQMEQGIRTTPQPRAGGQIGYEFQVTNTGASPLSGITISGPEIDRASCPAATLAPGGKLFCTASYTLSQDDLDAGSVTNSAVVRATTPGGRTMRDESSAALELTAEAELRMEKSAVRAGLDPEDALQSGQRIRYQFALRNAGNVTLTDLRVSDPPAGPVRCDRTRLAPEATTTCTAERPYVVDEADVDAGSVDNTATASGKAPAGAVIDSNASRTQVPSSRRPALMLSKQAGTPADRNDNGWVDAGDTIGYRFEVRNSGNVTLNSIAIEDQMTGPVRCEQTILRPQAVTTCAAISDYVVTSADVGAGVIENTATASARGGAGEEALAEDTTRTATDQVAKLDLVATAGDPLDRNANARVDLGDEIDYRYTVINSGTLPIAKIIVEDRERGKINCPRDSLQPGESLNCRASDPYAITQVDADAEVVRATARAAGTTSLGDPVAAEPATTQTTVPPVVMLGLLQQVEPPNDVNGNGIVDAGDKLDYVFSVTNVGSVSVTDVAVRNDLTGAGRCESASLAPGESTICRTDRSYVIDEADAAAKSVRNNARGTGSDLRGNSVRSLPADVAVDVG